MLRRKQLQALFRRFRSPRRRKVLQQKNLERLEDRRLLAIDGLGIAGDSLSDEYVNEDYAYAYNWVELLGMQRGDDVPLGELKIDDVDNWGEPRRKGYEFNWARAGATSETLLLDGQHTGVAGQITAGDISDSVLAIGQNDFFPYFDEGPYFAIYNDSWTQEEKDDYVAAVYGNISSALTTISTAGSNVVLSNVVDYGVAPYTQSLFPDPVKRQLVTDVIADLNSQLSTLALSHGIPLVDSFDLAADVLGAESITVGGNEITNTAGTAPGNIFVDDAIHPHTVASAAIANVYLEAFRLGYDNPVELIGEQEIVELVGLTYGGSDTFGLDYASFVDLAPGSIEGYKFHDLNGNAIDDDEPRWADVEINLLAPAVDDFQGGSTLGWTSGSPNPNPPQVVPDGGPEGDGDSYLHISSTGGGGAGSKLVAFNQAQWTGDLSELAGVNVWLNNFGDAPLSMRLGIDGPGGRFVSAAPVVLGTEQGWTEAFFSLSPADLFAEGSDLSATLSGATQLRLLHNPSAGYLGSPIETQLGVDNIVPIRLDETTQFWVSDTTVTDPDGHYLFDNVPAGVDHVVAEVLPDGTWASTASEFSVRLLSGQELTPENGPTAFGNYYPGAIHGYKFEDLSGNGLWEETLIETDQVNLSEGDALVPVDAVGVGYAQTFTAGQYGALLSATLDLERLGNAGDVIVEITTLSHVGEPTDNVLSSTSIPATSIPEGGTHQTVFDFETPAMVLPGEQYALVMFANAASETDTISWSVNIDTNPYEGGRAFSTPDAGSTWSAPILDQDGADDDFSFSTVVETNFEPSLPGVEILLSGISGTSEFIEQSWTSGYAGEFWFDDLPPGTYSILENYPVRYFVEMPFDGAAAIADGSTFFISDASGVTTFEFDTNDSADPANVAIALNGNEDQSTLRDIVLFAIQGALPNLHVAADGSDTIHAIAPLSSIIEFGDLPISVRQQESIRTSPTTIITLTSGTAVVPAAGENMHEGLEEVVVPELEIGNAFYGSISGVKWLDLTGDGASEDDTLFLDGMGIGLFVDENDNGIFDQEEADGGPFQVTTTDPETGEYRFEFLEPRQYFVAENPDQLIALNLIQTAGGDALEEGIPWYVVDLESGDDIEGLGFWNTHAASISGHKWEDVDGSGANEGEPLLDGWTIELWDADGNFVDSTVTESGLYEFQRVRPGAYTVVESSRFGWQVSYPQSELGAGIHSVVVGAGEQLQFVDFGNYRLGAVHGFKFEDTDRDASYDPEVDRPWEGIPFEIYKEFEQVVDDQDESRFLSAGFIQDGGAHTADPGELAIAAWHFEDLPAGTYEVSAHWPADPANATDAPFTIANADGPLLTVDVDQQLPPGETEPWEVLVEVEIHDGVLTVELTNDANGTVVADAIRLRASHFAGSTVTDDHGEFWIEHLTPGSYTVIEPELPGIANSTFNNPLELHVYSGDALAWEPGAAMLSDNIAGVSLSGDQEVPVVETEAYGYGEVRQLGDNLAYSIEVFGLALADITAMHIHAGERGVSGGVEFDILADLDVEITENPESVTIEGLWDIGDATSLPDAIIDIQDADFDADIPLYFNVHTADHPSGEIRGQLVKQHGDVQQEIHFAPLMFGNYFEDASIHGRKFHDLNQDGTRDEDEPWLPGWIIEAYDELGEIVNSAITMHDDPETPEDETGMYWLDVPQGAYAVAEGPLPPGWGQSNPANSGSQARASWQPDIEEAGFVFTAVETGREGNYLQVVIQKDDLGGGDSTVSFDGFSVVVTQDISLGDGAIDVQLGDAANAIANDEVASTVVQFSTSPASGTDGFNDFDGTWVFDLHGAIPNNAHYFAVSPGQVVEDVDFGNYRLDGSIHGRKWDDVNQDGVRDEDEPWLPGWIIEAYDESGEWINSAITMDDDPETSEDETGMYWLDVPEGLYAVAEAPLPPGWAQSSPLGPGTEASASWQPNVDADGFVFAAVEPGLEGNFLQVVIVKEDLDGAESTVSFDGTAVVVTQDISLGDETIDVQLGDAANAIANDEVASTVVYFTTAPDSGTAGFEDLEDTWVFDLHGALPNNAHFVSVSAGEPTEGWDFGNYREGGSIHGRKWEDINQDGIRDEDEPWLPGWIIEAYDESGEWINSAITMDDDPETSEDETGMYWLDVPEGLYAVAEAPLPPGWAQSSPLGPGTEASASWQPNVDADGFVFAAVEPGLEGNFLQVVIVKEDLDGAESTVSFDGTAVVVTQDISLGDETIDVQLGDAANAIANDEVASTVVYFTTAPESGTAGFEDLEDTWVFDLHGALPNNAHFVSVFAGEPTEGVDFGNYREGGSIHGRKWDDVNQDGVRDEDEPWLPGWIIEAYDESGEIVNSAITMHDDPETVEDETGMYWLDVPEGFYAVAEAPLPPGWAQSSPLGPGTEASASWQPNVDADGFVFAAVEPGLEGNFLQVVIVKEDLDGAESTVSFDGTAVVVTQDISLGDETIDVQLGDAANAIANDEVASTVVYFTSAPESGTAGFEDLEDTWVFDLHGALPNNAHFVSVFAGEPTEGVDFGNYREGGSIHGRKWDDVNQDGVRDEDEPWLPGWIIEAYDESGEIVNSAITMHDDPETVEDETGMYWLDVPEGFYAVAEAPLPPGWAQSSPLGPGTEASASWQPNVDADGFVFAAVEPGLEGNFLQVVIVKEDLDGAESTVSFDGTAVVVTQDISLGDETIDVQLGDAANAIANDEVASTVVYFTTAPESGTAGFEDLEDTWVFDLHGALPNNAHFVSVLAGEPTEGVDFGNYREGGSIHGRKWEDINQDGVRDEDEPWLPGWIIEAYDESGEYVTSAVTMHDDPETVEDETGMYWLDVPEGFYAVAEAPLPPGWAQSSPLGPGTEASASWQPNVDADGFVFAAVEPGLEGNFLQVVIVKEDLDGAESTVSFDGTAVVVTQDISLGDETIDVQLGDAANAIANDEVASTVVYFTSAPESGTAGFEDLEDTWVFDLHGALPNNAHFVSVFAGEPTEGVDFGNYREGGSIHGRKWDDVNQDGVRDEDEPWLPGWIIEAYDESGEIVNSAITMHDDPETVEDETGMYWLDVPEGFYAVAEAPLPPGWAQSSPLGPGTEASASWQPNVDADGFVFAAVEPGLEGNFLQVVIVKEDLDGAESTVSFDGTAVVVTQDISLGDETIDVQLGDAANAIANDEVASTVVYFTTAPESGTAGFEDLEDTWVFDLHGALPNNAHFVSVLAGEPTEGVDFGNYREGGSIHGRKWEDINQDGVRDEDEPWLPGWIIEAYDESGEWINSAITMDDDPETSEDETGMYWLDVPEGFYAVAEAPLPPGWAQSSPLGPGTEASASWQPNVDADGFVFAAVEPGLEGNFLQVVIVKEDLDGAESTVSFDGTAVVVTQDISLGDETIDVQLGDAANAIANDEVASTVVYFTSAPESGTAGFEDLEDTWVFDLHGALPNNAHFVSVFAGEPTEGVDFGNYREGGSIHGRKWDDVNQDGVRDEDEPWLPGWIIEAYDESGEIVNSAITMHDDPETVEDETGMYWLDVPEGFYAVAEAPLPPGWAQSSPLGPGTEASASWQPNVDADGFVFAAVEPGLEGNFLQVVIVKEDLDGAESTVSFDGTAVVVTQDISLGDETIDVQLGDAANAIANDEVASTVVYFTTAPESGTAGFEDLEDTWVFDLHGALPNNAHFVSVLAGEPTEGVDFGNYREGGSIHGRKWEDINQDGVRDEDEPWLPGWIIEAYDESGEYVTSAVTMHDDPETVEDETGMYWLDVPEGLYSIVELEQPGWAQSYPLNDAQTASAGWQPNPETDDTIAFLANEPGLAGNGLTVISIQGDVEAPAVTSIEDGVIEVTRHPHDPPTTPLQVLITINAIADHEQASELVRHETIADIGTHGYSDIDGTLVFELSGGTPANSHTIYVEAGQVVEGFDFGNYREAASLHGRKFDDLNADGIRDDNEPWLPGWVIEAYDEQGEIAGSAITMEDDPETVEDETGMYWLDVPPGNYSIVEVPNFDWLQTTPLSDPTAASASWQPNGEATGYVFTATELGLAGNHLQIVIGKDDLGGGESIVASDSFTIVVTQDIALADAPIGEQLRDAAIAIAEDSDASSRVLVVELEEIGTHGFEEVDDVWVFDLSGGLPQNTHYVSALPGDVIEGLDFGNHLETGSIYGRKWEDLDASGTYDAGEPWLPGWRVELWTLEGELIAETVTAEDDPDTLEVNEAGSYLFDNVRPGFYVVQEEQRHGWHVSYPAYPFDVDVEDGSHHAFVEPGAELLGFDFGNLRLGSLHGLKFEDVLGNGVYDEGDAPWGGVLFDLYENFSTQNAHFTQTGFEFDDDGVLTADPGGELAVATWEFDRLQPGTYDIAVRWTPAEDRATNAPFEIFDADGVLLETTVDQQVASGNTDDTWEVIATVEVTGDRVGVTLTNDADGLVDAGEVRISSTRLVRSDGTEANGEFWFENLWPSNYTVVEQNGENASTPTTWTTELLSGQELAWTEGAAMLSETVLTASLTGDQEVDPVESSAQGFAEFKLLDDGETLSYHIDLFGLDLGPAAGLDPLTEETDDDVVALHIHAAPAGTNGDPVFGIISPDSDDDLQIILHDSSHATLLGTWETTEESSLGTFVDALRNAELFEDVDLYVNVHTTANQSGEIRGQLVKNYADVQDEVVVGDALTFGNYVPGAIHGLKFRDLDGDGQLGDNEPPLSGVTIIASRVVGDDITGEYVGVTNEFGEFWIESLPPGEYSVTEIEPVEFIVTFPAEGGAGIDDGEAFTISDPLLGDTTFEFTLDDTFGAASVPITVTGNESTTELRDLVQGTIAQTLPLALESLGDDAIGAIVSAQTDLAFGDLNIIVQTNPFARTSPPLDGLLLHSGEALVAFEGLDTHGLNEFVVPALAIGNSSGGSIHGRKFHDLNEDGVRDEDEPWLPGWKIEVIDGDGNVVERARTMHDDPTTEEDETGLYWINVPAGAYTVVEEVRDGWLQSFPGDDPHVVSVEIGQEVTGIDFGNYINTGSIHGRKFEDRNADGFYEEGEPWLGGWTIELWNETGFVTSVETMFDDPETSEDETGWYWFDDVVPGFYEVRESQVPGWHQSWPTPIESDGFVEPGYYFTEVLAGETLVGLDFGNFTTGSLHGFKFEDVNADGIYDETVDRPLAGIEFELTSTFVAVVDDSSSNFATFGFEEFGDVSTAPSGSGDAIAEWFFAELPDGIYDVAASWTGGRSRATDATFTFSDGIGELGTATVDQQVASGEFGLDGFAWTHLGQVAVTDGFLSVSLTNDANGLVVADSILLTSGNVVATGVTNDAGEFWFEDLWPGFYTVGESFSDAYDASTHTSFSTVLYSGEELVWADGAAMLSDTVIVASLDGSQEVDPVDSDANGYAEFSLSGDGTALRYEIDVWGFDFGVAAGGDPLTEITDDDITGIHLHTAERGSNGDAVFGILSPNQDSDLEIIVHSDNYATLSGSWDLDDETNAPLSDFVDALVSADPEDDIALYLNVHSEAHPTGEIRGQLTKWYPDPLHEVFVGEALMFGNFQRGAIHGYKFFDANGDGVWDENEGPLSGVEIIAIHDDGREWSTITNELGEFWLDVPPGQYFLFELAPVEYTIIFPDTGAADTEDGESFVINDEVSVITFEFTRDPDVTDGAVPIEITGDETTAELRDLVLDTITQTLPLDLAAVGTDTIKGIVSPTTGVSFGTLDVQTHITPFVTTTPPLFDLQLGSGQALVAEVGQDMHGREEVVVPALAIGNAGPGSIHGRKFEDLDRNGVWNEGEPYLGGWRIAVLDAFGNELTHTRTMHDDPSTEDIDEGGMYWLDVPPGEYYVVEEIRGNWTQIGPVNDALPAFGVTDFGTQGAVEVEFTATEAGLGGNHLAVFLSSVDLGPDGGVEVNVFNGVVEIHLNNNVDALSTAQDVVDAILNDEAAAEVVNATLLVGDGQTQVASTPSGLAPVFLFGGQPADAHLVSVGLGQTIEGIDFANLRKAGVEFAVDTFSIGENASEATITVVRTGDTTGSFSIDFATADGSAVAGADYDTASGTLHFAPDETSLSFPVTIHDDVFLEENETIHLTLSNPVGDGIVGDLAGAVLAIIDDEIAAGELRFVAEAFAVDEAAGTATVTVERVKGTQGAVSVEYRTNDDSADAGSDYTATNGLLTFADGQTQTTFTIPISDDDDVEPTETIALTLFGPIGGATLGEPRQAIVEIFDNDFSVDSLRFDFNVDDSATEVGFIGVAPDAVFGPASRFGWDRPAAANETGLGSDLLRDGHFGSVFHASTFSVVVDPSDDPLPVTTCVTVHMQDLADRDLVDVFNADNESQGLFNLLVPGGTPFSRSFVATSGDDGVLDLTIRDNGGENPFWMINGLEIELGTCVSPGQLHFAIDNFPATESVGSATLLVTRTGGTEGAVSVDYVTSSGSATAGTDFTSTGGTLNFADGEIVKIFSVSLIDDTIAENDETINLTLLDPTGGATLGEPSTAVITILDNERNDPPMLHLITPLVNYEENDTPRLLDPLAELRDTDSPDFQGGSLTVFFEQGGTPADQLSIRERIGLSIDGDNVSFNERLIGVVNNTLNGRNGVPLQVDFTTSDATVEAARALAQSVTYFNSSDDPQDGLRDVRFTVNDGDGAVSGGLDNSADSLKVFVHSANDAPTAGDDAYFGLEDQRLEVSPFEGLLANDRDPDDREIIAVLLEEPSNGLLSQFNSDGSFVYIPNADFNGIDTFTYLTTDRADDSLPATVTLSIQDVFDGPPLLIVDTELDIVDAIAVDPTPATPLTVADLQIANGADGRTSLREAVTAANNTPGTTIEFAPELNGLPIVLTQQGSGEDANTSGDLDILTDVTILGNGPLATIIDGGSATSSDVDRVFHVHPTVGEATIRGVTIQDGSADLGGGVLTQGTLLLQQSELINNSALDGGGGIRIEGGLIADGITIAGNTALFGGGIDVAGIAQVASLTNSTVSGNVADQGGGINVEPGQFGLLVASTTITENRAVSATLPPELIGGGILANGFVHLTNTIVASNDAGAVEGDPVDDVASDVSGFVAPFSNYNLIGDPAGLAGISDGDGNWNLVGHDAMLSPLGDHGGPTRTHALHDGSPAVDAGLDFAAGVIFGGFSFDQRGSVRPIDNPNVPNAVGGDGSDIGSFELLSTLLVDTHRDVDDALLSDPTPETPLTLLDLVSNPGADGRISLREAITAANNSPGTTIGFSVELDGVPISLTKLGAGEDDNASGDLDIHSDVKIVGRGPRNTILQGVDDRVLQIHDGAATIEGVRIQLGSVEGDGGGIDNRAALTVAGSTVTNNSATSGGAISNSGALTVVGSTLVSNLSDAAGGAISNTGILTVDRSTLSNNTSLGGGGGIADVGTAAVLSSTITGNRAGSGESGGGILVVDTAATSLHNTIVAGNSQGFDIVDDVSGSVDPASSFNLIGDGTGLAGIADADANGNLVGHDPLLGPLANNGGPTRTHTLLPGSPAIDAGNDHGGSGKDQKGGARPVDQATVPNAGDGSDIGAVEIGVSVVTLDADNNLTLTDNTDTSNAPTIAFVDGQFVIADTGSGLTADIPGATQDADGTIRVPFDAVPGGIVLGGGEGDDTLTIDLSQGDPPSEITFAGGGNETEVGDSIIVKGPSGQVQTLNFDFMNKTDGRVELDIDDDGLADTTINYTGLEPFDTEGITADTVNLSFQAANDLISITDLGNGRITVDSNNGETTTFNRPTTELIIVGGAGGDVVMLSEKEVPIRFEGGTGLDELMVEGADTRVSLSQLSNVDRVDIRGTGDNTLSVDQASALANVDDADDTLIVIADGGDQIEFDSGWQFSGTTVQDGTFFRVLNNGDATLHVAGPADWQNPVAPVDVDFNGIIAPLDVLHMINIISGVTNQDVVNSDRELADPTTIDVFPDVFPDVDGNGLLVPLDVLLVVDHIVTANSGTGEGEAFAEEAADTPLTDNVLSVAAIDQLLTDRGSAEDASQAESTASLIVEAEAIHLPSNNLRTAGDQQRGSRTTPTTDALLDELDDVFSDLAEDIHDNL